MAQCLADAVAYDFVLGRLDGSALRDVEAHVNACAPCREVIAQTAKYLDEERATQLTTLGFFGSASSPNLARGTEVGRYAVTGVIGSGGMGVVYCAYDPNLERNVALKLLRSEHSSRQDRLLREARAMARLSHPNVVAVYDTGMFGDQIFVAMELVSGVTLRSWLDGKPSWQEVLAVFVAAGRGLAHAHANGLVHRDFKPENVLISTDGRVRVSDFGLAQPTASSYVDVSSSQYVAHHVQTQTGLIAGTPAYMAPEQLAGQPPDPRTDQYSFGIALYEALYGTRDTSEQPRDRAVPDWLRAIIMRGTREKPAERFASMDELLVALARGSSTKRKGRRIVMFATSLVVGTASLAFVVWRAQPASEPPPPPNVLTTEPVVMSVTMSRPTAEPRPSITIEQPRAKRVRATIKHTKKHSVKRPTKDDEDAMLP